MGNQGDDRGRRCLGELPPRQREHRRGGHADTDGRDAARVREPRPRRRGRRQWAARVERWVQLPGVPRGGCDPVEPGRAYPLAPPPKAATGGVTHGESLLYRRGPLAHTPRPKSAEVAQLVRAGVSYALGRGFNSLLRHSIELVVALFVGAPVVGPLVSARWGSTPRTGREGAATRAPAPSGSGRRGSPFVRPRRSCGRTRPRRSVGSGATQRSRVRPRRS